LARSAPSESLIPNFFTSANRGLIFSPVGPAASGGTACRYQKPAPSPGFFEVATSAPISVRIVADSDWERCTWRYAPELLQGTTMSNALTQLLIDVLAAWAGPLPRLCSVTGAGDQERTYSGMMLWPMWDPRTRWSLERF
jgi:hypothetical protein